MRTVQLAKHLAEHVAEVEVVVDVGQESLVGLAVAGPVYAVQPAVVEFLLHLPPYVFKQILTFLVWLIVERCLESNAFSLALGEVNLLDTASAAQV